MPEHTVTGINKPYCELHQWERSGMTGGAPGSAGGAAGPGLIPVPGLRVPRPTARPWSGPLTLPLQTGPADGSPLGSLHGQSREQQLSTWARGLPQEAIRTGIRGREGGSPMGPLLF